MGMEGVCGQAEQSWGHRSACQGGRRGRSCSHAPPWAERGVHRPQPRAWQPSHQLRTQSPPRAAPAAGACTPEGSPALAAQEPQLFLTSPPHAWKLVSLVNCIFVFTKDSRGGSPALLTRATAQCPRRPGHRWEDSTTFWRQQIAPALPRLPAPPGVSLSPRNLLCARHPASPSLPCLLGRAPARTITPDPRAQTTRPWLPAGTPHSTDGPPRMGPSVSLSPPCPEPKCTLRNSL